MTIILGVLKWIGLILLGVLGVLLIVLISVLMLPIAYEGYMQKYETLLFDVKLRIFYFLSIEMTQKDEKLSQKIKVFGYTLKPKKEKKKEIKKEIKKAPKQAAYSSEKVKEADDHKTPEKIETISAKTSKKVKKSKKTSKIHLKERIDQVKKVWTDEHRKAFFSALWKLIKKLIRRIRPKFFRFKLIIGKEMPHETGALLAKLVFAFPLYYRYGEIIGDFEEPGITGAVEARGKFNLISLITPILSFLLNDSVRKYIQLLLNVGKEESNGKKAK